MRPTTKISSYYRSNIAFERIRSNVNPIRNSSSIQCENNHHQERRHSQILRQPNTISPSSAVTSSSLLPYHLTIHDSSCSSFSSASEIRSNLVSSNTSSRNCSSNSSRSFSVSSSASITHKNNHTEEDEDPLNHILTAPPGGLSENLIHLAVNMVAQYSFGYEGRQVNTDLALQILERLVQEELSSSSSSQQQEIQNNTHPHISQSKTTKGSKSKRSIHPNKQIVKRGMVFNVLKSCAKYTTKPESLFRLESLHIMIGERGSSSPHLWHTNLSSYFLSALVKCKHPDAPKFAEGLLMDLEELHTIHPDQSHPEGIQYASVIAAFCIQRNDTNAERLLYRLMDKFESRQVSNGLNSKLCNQVLNTIATSHLTTGSGSQSSTRSGKSKSQRGQTLVDRMIDLNAKYNYHWLKPDVISYTSLIHCYCNDGQIVEAEHVLWQMFELHHARYLNRCPDTRAFTIIFNAMANQQNNTASTSHKKKQVDIPQRILALVEKMEEMTMNSEDDNHNQNCGRSVIAYNSALNALGKFGMVSEAEDLVQHMHDLHDNGQLHDGPNHITYSSLIHALSQSNRGGSSDRAKVWYEKMVELNATGQYPNMKPDSPIFTNLIRTFANEGLGSEAEETLKLMNRLYEQGDLQTRPSQVVYSCTIDALARCGDADAPQRAEAVLEQMITNTYNPMTPNEYVLTSLLHCYASHGLSRKADRLLQRMHKMHQNGQFKSGGPTGIAYGCVINALARSSEENAHQRAKELLDQMWAYCKEDSNELLRPNSIVYNSVMNCYAVHGLGTEAELLLQEMEEFHKSGQLRDGGPCNVSYLTALNALAKSRDLDAPERARKLLDSMVSNPKVERTHHSYNMMLLCYAAHGRTKEAEQLMKEMIDLFITGDLEERPDTKSFNTLLDSLSRSSIHASEDDVTGTAINILKTMIELRDAGYQDVDPDESTVSIFLRCFGAKGQYKQGKKYIQELTGLVVKPTTPSK